MSNETSKTADDAFKAGEMAARHNAKCISAEGPALIVNPHNDGIERDGGLERVWQAGYDDADFAAFCDRKPARRLDRFERFEQERLRRSHARAARLLR